MKCPHCGASIYDDINRCQYCGSYVTPVQQQAPAQQGQQQPVIVNVYQPEPQTIHHETHIYHTEPVSEKIDWWHFFCACFLADWAFISFTLVESAWASYTYLRWGCAASAFSWICWCFFSVSLGMETVQS